MSISLIKMARKWQHELDILMARDLNNGKMQAEYVLTAVKSTGEPLRKVTFLSPPELLAYLQAYADAREDVSSGRRS